MELELLYGKLAAPARRALEELKPRKVEDLAKRTEAELAGLHGIGPSALEAIKAELKALGLGLKDDGGSRLVDDYIKAFPKPVRDRLEAMRAAIRKEAPEASERISYGMPTFYLKGNLVHYAAFKAHIGFYPTPSGTEEFQEKIARYKHNKGSIQFPLEEDLPLDLVREIVRFRVGENSAQAQKGRKA